MKNTGIAIVSLVGGMIIGSALTMLFTPQSGPELLTALVIWLSSVTGSFIASALIAGGFFAVLALLVYLFAIRDAVEQIRRQAETVYEVAHAAQTGYEWLAGKVSLFLKLREELQKK